jgi:predicted transcriptional regulator
MIRSAEALGSPGGWPGGRRRSLAPPLREIAAAYLGEELFSVVIELVEGGRRIPEEALGMREMREGMGAIKLR